MPQPEYRVKASGMGGSGYARPPLPGEESKVVKNADSNDIKVAIDPDTGKAIVVPGVTTVLKAFGDAPALVQWKIDQTAAYAAANVDALLNRTVEQGFAMLRWYHKRVPDLDDPIRNAANGVLNDLAELGTNVHEWIQTDVDRDAFYPPITSVEMAEMVDAWNTWRFVNDVKPGLTEVTVYGDGYAGTFDLQWWINGKYTLGDIKTSRAVRDGHLAQLAALRAARMMFVKDEEGEWKEVEVPEVEQYGFIQARPDDTDNKGNFIPRFVKFHEVSGEILDLHYRRFMNMLDTLQIDRKLKSMEG